MSHISDIRLVERCEKLYWLSKKEPIKGIPFVNYNENMSSLVKEYFMIQECFEGAVNDEGEKAVEAMKTFSVLMNARFVKDDLRIKIPLMIKGETGWNVYFTYVLPYPKESDAQRISDHISVLKACGICVEHVYAIHLNAQYVRGETLDVRSLLCVSEYLYNHKNHANHTIMELISTKERDVFALLPQLRALDEAKEVDSVRKKACTRGGKCNYFELCFPKEEETSIHRLFGAKLEHLEHGVQEIKDLDFALLEGTRQQFAQYMAAKQGKLYMDRFAMENWIKHAITYPISYLDFEWETFAYPPYQGMKPYDVLTFQYSLHVESEHKAPLLHYEFLSEGDCREAFVKQLLHDLPKTGTILVFNMEGAEKLRLKQLAQQFPSYAEELDAICERMVDLSLPFSTGNIYDNQMDGYFSLKKLVSIFSEYRYEDLDIGHGMDAVMAWRQLKDASDEEKAIIRKQLLEYCALDTFGEVLVFHKILALLKGEEA